MTFATAIYVVLLTRSTFNLFGVDPFGLVFNSMLDHMLHGRWDVDPAEIGNEAFVVEGRSYAYFGPVPALLRLPLLIFPYWKTLHVERLSCLVAMLIGMGAQLETVWLAMADVPAETRRRLEPILCLACAFSGPPLLLALKGALIYHEAILWAWALAMLFVTTILRSLRRHGTLPTAVLCLMGVEAGLCLMSRSTTGLGLFVVLGLILLRNGLAALRSQSGWRELLRGRILAPTAILIAFLAVAALLNEGRWHNPFSFADLRRQIFQVAAFPDRLQRLTHYGLFNIRRLPIGVLYYVFPVWTDRLNELLSIGGRLHTLFDAAECPATSILLTDPLWCVLAAYGAVLMARRRISTDAMLLVLGLSVAPVLMLTAWYLAFRYRVEFAPLLFTLSCLALSTLARQTEPGRVRRLHLLFAVLFFWQIAGTVTASFLYAEAPFGPQPGYPGLSLAQDFQPSIDGDKLGVSVAVPRRQ